MYHARIHPLLKKPLSIKAIKAIKAIEAMKPGDKDKADTGENRGLRLPVALRVLKPFSIVIPAP
ncbi:hypothetical protein yaldo0001_28270 [Yersinia aldovae ATCC 35236]|uniref:hypothetical protein n=1 Tax=Yersinia aldovae TaxID=29483 RepID=UPI0001A55EC1|nr:hypothetical protein [Yersinia aldovae]EEP95356.1 hypothetical protein yaldo0001_28270 [Yersinia aldovae ATCC 35236]